MTIRTHSFLSTLFMFLFLLFNFSHTKSKEIQQHGDLKTSGMFTTEDLIVKSPVEIEVEKMNLKELKVKEINSPQTNANIIITDKLSSSNSEGTIHIKSLLKINGEITYKNFDNGNSSFLELSNIYIDGIKQWRNVHFFSEGKSFDDINIELNKKICEKNNMKNYEVELDLQLVNEIKGKHYKVEMLYEFVNKYWNKNIAYIKIGDDFYWTDNHNWGELTKEDKQDETFWQNPLTFIIPGRFVKEEKIKLIFGIKVNQRNPDFCQQKTNLLHALRFSQLTILVK